MSKDIAELLCRGLLNPVNLEEQDPLVVIRKQRVMTHLIHVWDENDFNQFPPEIARGLLILHNDERSRKTKSSDPAINTLSEDLFRKLWWFLPTLP